MYTKLQLEGKKLLIRARDGAMSTTQVVSFDMQLGVKHKLHMSEKVRIGKAAAKLIKESDSLIMDSGTTTLEIIRNIDPSLNNVTVIINALNIANQLVSAPNVNLIIPGGVLGKIPCLSSVLWLRKVSGFFLSTRFFLELMVLTQ